MNLLEAARKVDRSDSNKATPDPHGLSDKLALHIHNYDWVEVTTAIQEFWITRRLDRDEEVGIKAGFVDGELSFIWKQTGRRSPGEYFFVSQEAANRLRLRLFELCSRDFKSDLLDVSEEIPELYTAHHGNQIVVEKGLYQGKAVTHKPSDYYRMDDYDIYVTIDETQEKVKIPCSEFQMPIHTVTEDVRRSHD